MLDQVVKSDVVFPAPVIEGVHVIERAWPCVCDGLSEVRNVLNSELWNESKENINKILIFNLLLLN